MCDEFVDVYHADCLPKGAVTAMHRGLETTDETIIDSYVCLCRYNNEAVFGRACLKDGKLHAWFPWGGKEIYSGEIGNFQILVNRGRECNKGFKYTWQPVYRVKSKGKYLPVDVGGVSPAVIPECNFGGCNGELLGKIKIDGSMAWTSYDGKENVHTGGSFERAYVLCRKQYNG